MFGGHGLVVDLKATRGCVMSGRGDVFGSRIYGSHGATKAGDGLGDEAAAASDIKAGEIEKRSAGGIVEAEMSGCGITNEAEAGRTDAVQHAEWAARIPPFVRERGKLSDFPGIYVVGGRARRCRGHGRFQFVSGAD